MLYKIEILGQKWKVFLHEEEYYVKVYGDNDSGHTTESIKEIHINNSELNLETIVHELVHAFYASLCIRSAHVDVEQQEEILCEMFALHGSKILKLGKDLYKEMCS